MTASNTLLGRHLKQWWTCRLDIAQDTPITFTRKAQIRIDVPHNFRLFAFGRRSYVRRKRDVIASGSIAIKDFHENLIGFTSFNFLQAHCLAWVTAVAVFLLLLLLLKHPDFFAIPFTLLWRIACCCIMSVIRRLHFAFCAASTTDQFVADFISRYVFRITSSVESFTIISIRVQILDETDCISHSTNTLGEGMNPIILPPAMGK